MQKGILGQRNIFPRWQSSKTLIDSPFIPSSFPALGKVEASTCLGVSLAGLACNLFLMDLLMTTHHQLLERGSCFLPRDPVDFRDAHILHLTLALFALNWTESQLQVSTPKAIKKKSFLNLRGYSLKGVRKPTLKGKLL